MDGCHGTCSAMCISAVTWHEPEYAKKITADELSSVLFRGFCNRYLYILYVTVCIYSMLSGWRLSDLNVGFRFTELQKAGKRRLILRDILIFAPFCSTFSWQVGELFQMFQKFSFFLLETLTNRGKRYWHGGDMEKTPGGRYGSREHFECAKALGIFMENEMNGAVVMITSQIKLT